MQAAYSPDLVMQKSLTLLQLMSFSTTYKHRVLIIRRKNYEEEKGRVLF